MGNDTSCEVNEYFKRMYLYQEGNEFKWTEEQIADSLLTYYQDSINSHDSIKCDFFFGLAESMWQVGKIEIPLIKMVDYLVNSETDHLAAKSLDASEKYLQERKTATKNFLEKIQQDNAKPKTRELKSNKLSVFVSGDCLNLRYDGWYYGLVVTDDARNTDDGTNQFAFTNIRQKKKPVLTDFKRSVYLVTADIAAHLSNTPGDALLDILFSFKANRNTLLKEMALIENVGNLNSTRSFYERQFLRVTDMPGKIPSLVKLVKAAADFWNKQEWRISNYIVVSIVKSQPYSVMAKSIRFADRVVKFSDVYITVENSLWHINVWVHIANIEINTLENYWLIFAELIENKTGREVNQFYFKKDRDSEMLPFNKVDFTKYKLRHVKDCNNI